MGEHKLRLKMETADEFIIESIVKRKRKGESYTSIARIFGCSGSTIKRYIEEWNRTYPETYRPNF